MKIVITQRFMEKYLKPLSKYFTKNDFIELLNERNHTFISLHLPFFKLKNKINNFSFRGVVVVRNNERIIPLMLFAKKDKKYGENIYWDGYKDFIVSEYEKTLEDIREEKFEEF